MLTKREEFEDGSSTVTVVADDGASIDVRFPPGFDPMEAHCIASGRFARLRDLKDFNPRALIRARLYDLNAARLYPRALDAVLGLLEDEQVKLWASCERNSDDHVAMAIQGPLHNVLAGVPSIEDLCDAADHVAIGKWFDVILDENVKKALARDLTRILREK